MTIRIPEIVIDIAVFVASALGIFGVIVWWLWISSVLGERYGIQGFICGWLGIPIACIASFLLGLHGF